jgi:hypothetical protein
VNWKALECQFQGKTSQQIFERWTKVLDPKLHKGSWTRQEDEVIIRYVQTNGRKSWTKLADLLPGRIGKQCRERWMNHLDPAISRGPWTREEDHRLMVLHKEYGNRWSKIASLMPSRSDNMIKNRWYSILAKKDIEDVARAVASEKSAPDDVPVPLWDEPPTSPSLAFISPVVPRGSPFTLVFPDAKMSPLLAPWASDVGSPERKKASLLENRAALMNLIVQHVGD